MRSSRIYKGQSSKSKEEVSQKNLPRKCAVVRRTYPEPDVMKTELRFVSYKRPEGDLDEKEFFKEVSQFLKEQMEDMGKNDENATKTANTTSTLSEEALSSTHHDTECGTSGFLKRAIPSIEKLVEYYKQMAKKTDDVQYRILRMTAKNVLRDTQKALISGGADEDLIGRIKLLNGIQQNI